MPFPRRGAAHDFQGHIKGEAERFAQYRCLSRKRVQGDAHVVIDKLHANAHPRPACVNQFIAHRHQHRRGAFNLFGRAARQQEQRSGDSMIRRAPDRHIHQAETLFSHVADQRVGLQRMNGGHINHQRVAGQPVANAVLTKQNGAHQVAVWQHGDDKFGIGCRLCRGCRCLCAALYQSLNRLGVYIKDAKLVALL